MLCFACVLFLLLSVHITLVKCNDVNDALLSFMTQNQMTMVFSLCLGVTSVGS